MSDATVKLYGLRDLLMTIRCENDLDARWVAQNLFGCNIADIDTEENDTVSKVEVVAADGHVQTLVRVAVDPRPVWDLWGRMPDDGSEPSPVKRIARALGLTTAEVAAIVYPLAEGMGEWDDSQEPDLPPD